MNENQREITVEAAHEGQRIDAFLAQQLGVSRSRAQEILERTRVAGRVVKAKYAVKTGDVLEIEWVEAAPEKAPVVVTDEPMPPILWQDDAILVIDKPRGLTVHAGAGETGATLVDILRAHGVPLSGVGPHERAGIVHRLDKDTSGAMIVAKTDEAHWKLAADFEARQIEKIYFALCNGVPPTKGRIEAPIARSQSNRKKMAVSPEGRPSVTEYEVTQKWRKFAALRVHLLTGRTHQIRVHLQYIHHAIVGDAIYGGYHRSLEAAPNAQFKAAVEALDGQALHAQKLAFCHPISGEKLEIESPLPASIGRVLEALVE